MISIIIPCYNYNTEVIKAVNSSLGQKDYSDFEVILVDDGSNTPVVNQWDNPRFCIIRHPKNLGLSAALNTGISQSNGDRYVICSADDTLHPHYLAHMAPHSADIVSCDMSTPGGVIQGKPGDLNILPNSNCHNYAALIKKSVWKAAGGYNIHMNPSWEDWEFFLHAAKLGAKWEHVNLPLLNYNRSPHGRDADAQDKTPLLQGLMRGFHQDIYGKGTGLVTFIIPCYKHEQFVAEAVSSALSQTYPHVAVVVVDDGSPGNVRAALQPFADNGKVALVRQRNKHLSAARNAGINYAIKRWNTQYIVPLDADDTVHPDFIKTLLPVCEYARYAYCDVQFIGDASHTFETLDYDCKLLTRKHLHACTMILDITHWHKLVASRGYGFDETMKKGYEDWEFELALAKNGVCGVRVPKYLFNYRFHENGSMRTAATKINKELSEAIKKRQPWIANPQEVVMACSTCGKSRYTIMSSKSGGTVSYNIPGIGTVPGDELIMVHYSGTQSSTITKVSPSGTLYKYSANPTGTFKPDFTIFAKDIHLFNGPYTFAKLNQVPEPAPVVYAPASIPVPTAVKPVSVTYAEPGSLSLEQKLQISVAKEATMEITAYDPDDFTQLKWVGEAGAKKLLDAGFSYYEDVIDATVSELAVVLGMAESKVGAVKKSAESLLKALT